MQKNRKTRYIIPAVVAGLIIIVLASCDYTKKYEEALASFDSLVTTIDTEEKPLQLVNDIRGAANNIRAELKTLRLLLIDVLKIIVK